MEWLTANWFWVLIFAAFIGMHLFGHGGHGGHRGHGGNDRHAGHGDGDYPRRLDDDRQARGDDPQARAGNPGSRRHGHC